MSVYAMLIGMGGLQVLTLVFCGFLAWGLLRQERTPQEPGRVQEPTSGSATPGGVYGDGEKREFGSEFREARLRETLQTAGRTRQDLSEKYKYVACMADKGLGSEDLAQAFGISSYEAEQLVNLSRLAGSVQR